MRPDDFDGMRRFYCDVLDRHPVYEPGHLACVDVSGSVQPLAVTVREAEPHRPAGTRELFFWVDDVDVVRQRADAAGYAPRLLRLADGRGELELTDPQGNLVRVHSAR